MSFTFRALLLGLLCLAQIGLASCDDNVSCIFTTGCQGGGGAVGIGAGVDAIVPADGLWIADGRPVITDVYPQGNDVHPDSPLVIVFSESMNAESLEDAFEVVTLGGNLFLPPIQIERQVLLAEGRVLVLFPSGPMRAGGFTLRLRAVDVSAGPFGGASGADAPDPVTDLTGQKLDVVQGTNVGEVFTVTTNPPTAPRVVALWPDDGTTDASQTTSIVAVFDRELDDATVTDASFQVEEAGAAPTLDPVAEALLIDNGAMTDTRVFTWRSASTSGVASPLAVGATIDVELSNPGALMRDTDGTALAFTSHSFTIASFGAPLSGAIQSVPSDAIGRRNLTADGDEDLEIEVALADAQDGDVLDLFLFGTNTAEIDPVVIALRRQITLTGVGAITLGTFGISDVDLTVGNDPDQPRFADGALTIAFRLRRGATLSPLRVLDVDATSAGIQDPLLDTIAPQIDAFDFGTGSTASSASDVRDLVLTGSADSVLRSVEVTASDGGPAVTNGTLPPVVGSRADGAFVAAPVPFGVLATGAATFTAIGYDQAYNASPPVSGSFTQRGAVGPGAFIGGDTLRVEVFDAETLDPLENARVIVHSDAGDGVNYPFTGSGLTAADGMFSQVTVGGAAGTIVTVDLAGYDLFTFHGVSSDFVSVPLRASGGGPTAAVMGDVQAADGAIELILPGLDRRMDDSRRPFGSPRAYTTAACVPNPVFGCAFGPEPVLPGRLGVQSFFAGNFQASEVSFNASLVLQAFCLETPLASIESGMNADTTFTLPFLLIDSSVVVEEKPDELDSFLFRADGVAGIDLGNLDDDLETTGVPRVTVETLVPGIAGTVAVGLGLAFDQGGDMWNVRSARPGAVSPAGFFGVNGTVDTDLFVRCELRDLDGNVSGVRPRLSELPMLPVAGTTFSADVPVLTTPAPGGSTGGRAYDLVFADTLPDASGEEGLYHARMVDSANRGWDLWRVDSTGAGVVRIRAIDVGLVGGNGFADGAVEVRLEAFSWGSLDATEFLWSDVEREHDLFARSEPFTFTQTP